MSDSPDNVVNFDDRLHGIDEVTERRRRAGGGGGPPPTAFELDDRLQQVEASVVKITAALPGLASKTDLATTQAGIVNSVRWTIVVAAVTTIATVVATAFGIQQMTVSTFRAAAETVQPASSQLAPIIVNVPTPAAPTSSLEQPRK